MVRPAPLFSALFLIALFPPSIVAQGGPGSWQGSLEVVWEELDDGTSRKRYFLDTGAEILEVSFKGPAPAMSCSAVVSARGVKNGGSLVVEELREREAPGACSTRGDQKTAVLLVSYPGYPVGVTAAQAREAVFGAAYSADGYLREASYTQTSLSGDVFGPVTLARNFGCNETYEARTAAIAALDAAVDFSQYRRIVLVLPKLPGCSLFGLGSVGCAWLSSGDGSFNASTVWLPGDKFTSSPNMAPGIIAHEMGHNFGLEHSSSMAFTGEPLGPFGAAGTHGEYGDHVSLMGSLLCSGTRCATGHYAAKQKMQLGWIALGGNILQVETAGTFRLQPLSVSTAAVQALRVRRAPGADAFVWVEFRQATGQYESSLSVLGTQVFSGAVVRYEDTADTLYPGHTRLLNMNTGGGGFDEPALAAGRNWLDPYSPLTIRVLSAGANGLDVQISYDQPCASLSPASGYHPAPATSAAASIFAACQWLVSNAYSWITVTGAQSGTGNGTLAYQVSANGTSAERWGVISVGRNTFVVRQTNTAAIPTCNFSASPASARSSSAGATITVTVTTSPGCWWTASAADSWLSFSGASQGTGSGSVRVVVSANTTPLTRSGSVTAAGTRVDITQTPSLALDEAFVRQLYLDLLGRQADAGGLAAWMNALAAGQLTRAQVAQGFFTSPEFSISGLFLIKCYLAVLRRDPDFGGWEFWLNQLRGGASTTSILASFLTAPEFTLLYGNLADPQFVVMVYQNVLQRTPSQTEVNAWLSWLQGRTRAQMMEGFITSPEFDLLVRNRAYANLLYMGFLRRTAEPAGLAAWIAYLGANPLSSAILGFITSPEYAARF